MPVLHRTCPFKPGIDAPWHPKVDTCRTCPWAVYRGYFRVVRLWEDAPATATLDPGSFYLTFELPNHQTRRFSEFACCFGVIEDGFPSLDDPHEQLLRALFAMTGLRSP